MWVVSTWEYDLLHMILFYIIFFFLFVCNYLYNIIGIENICLYILKNKIIELKNLVNNSNKRKKKGSKL